MKKINRIMIKGTAFLWFSLCIVVSSFAQSPDQSENLVVTSANINPRPTTVGGTVKACFIFEATNGATLNLAAQEEIAFIVGFNKIDPTSIQNATITKQENIQGSQNAISWNYLPGPKTWTGKITQNLMPFTGGEYCFNNLIVAAPATVADANNKVGIGFSVNLVPHSKDPSGLEADDFTDNYTFTSASADLAVSKTVSNSSPDLGSQVTFTITASNNGTSNATGVKVLDQLPAGYTLVSATPNIGTWTAPNWNIGNLANGASATLTVLATVNAVGPYGNTATITGIEPDPNPNNNTSTVTPTPPAAAPQIRLIKTGVLSANGNTVTYGFTVKNTGNLVLSPVTVNDPKLMPSSITLAANTLAPGAQTTGTATYTVTAADRIAGKVVNTATATGTPPVGTNVTDVSGTTFDNNTPTEVLLPNISIVKTGVLSVDKTTITYTFNVKNTGSLMLTSVSVNDPLITPSNITLMTTTLAPGASTTGTATYTITPANRTLGYVENQATATGTPPTGANVTDKSGTTFDNDTTTIVPVPKCPAGVNCFTVKVIKG